MKTSIRVIIFTDYTLLGEGLKRLLDNAKNIKVVTNTTNITEAIEAFKKLMPSVLVMDSAMLDKEGQILMDYIKDNQISIKVLLLMDSIDENLSLWKWNLPMGVFGFLPRCTSRSDMINAIQKGNNGEIWLEGMTISKLNNSQDISSLSKEDKLSLREKEVVNLVIHGYSNKEIAQNLNLSEKTIKCHLTNIFKKMDVNSRFKIMMKYPRDATQNSNLI